MKPSFASAYDDGFCRMYVGDAIDVLSQLPEKSVHCCVTSPPYFGLRSYLPSDHQDKAREGGTQETPEQYVAWLVDVFRGVWRVLRDDGTLWLNLGDSYASGIKGSCGDGSSSGLGLGADGSIRRSPDSPKRWVGTANFEPQRIRHGLKPKDLLMMPARVALALQADGWYLRSQIVWTKPNPMPESVTDRPTQATEMVYLLTKKPRYFYDAEAVKERMVKGAAGSTFTDGKTGVNGLGRVSEKPREDDLSGRNLRNYWQISTRAYPGSHYATFPPELPLRCIKAGTSEHGVCSVCGAPWRRVVERGEPRQVRWAPGPDKHTAAVGGKGKTSAMHTGVIHETHTIGFEPTCHHKAETIPATVLDPFSGSGTTGLVARKLGRRSVLIDLDDRNVKLLEERMGYQGVLL